MKITVLSNKSKTLDELRRALDGNVHGASYTYLEYIDEHPDLGRPEIEGADLLILDNPWQNAASMTAVETLSGRRPQLTILLLCPSRAPETLISAMRAGVREVLPFPVTRKELLDAVERAKSRIAIVQSAKPQGRILAFLSCKGGSGATFIATNLGYTLATEHNKKVLLIDLDLQYGDASFFMTETKNAVTVAEVAKQIERLDGTFLAASSIEIAPNYALLSAPEDAERAVGIVPEHIDHLLNVAVENYDFVILDLERSIDAVSMRALDRAHLVFPVMQPMLPYVRDTQKLLRVFRMLGYPDSKVRLIANRCGKSMDLPLKKIEKTLGVDFYRTMPNDFDNASTSVNQGVPILKLAPGSHVSHMLKEFARDLAGAAKDHESWLGKFFRAA